MEFVLVVTLDYQLDHRDDDEHLKQKNKVNVEDPEIWRLSVKKGLYPRSVAELVPGGVVH